MNAPLPWHQAQWEAVLGAHAGRRLHHALLAAGPPRVGKAAFLAALAGYLLCESPRDGQPCGHCRGCRQHAAGTHPDCMVLSPDHLSRPVLGTYPGQRCQYDNSRKKAATVINVEQVRELGERLHASAHYGGYKLAVLLPADALNTAAANALLKLLEEPPDNTLFLLLSQRLAQLPATVRSRCQVLRFHTPTPAQARAALGADEHAALALELAGGAPLRAKDLLAQDIGAVWQAVGTGLAALLGGDTDPLQLARDWLKLPQDALDVALYGWLRRALRRAAGLPEGEPVPPARLHAFWRELEDFLRLREHPLVKELALQRLLYTLWAAGDAPRMPSSSATPRSRHGGSILT